MTSDVACPRCGSTMVRRTNSQSGEPFLGCSRFPGCRGTRPLAGGSSRAPVTFRPRYKLSAGGRARNIPDVVELLVARAIGRNLTPIQGCIVQVLAVAIFAGLFYAFLVSGLFMRVVDLFAQWYASQVFPTPTAAP
jgi:hypothetical protein